MRAGLPDRYLPEPDTKAFGLGKNPRGLIRVEDDSSKKSVYVRGVKVRCHYLVNIGTGYTDYNGYYIVDHKFVCDPHYALVYDNAKDFTIWGNYAFVAAANDNLGYQNKAGYNPVITTSSDGWKWAVINNAAYDFYHSCESDGIKTPPEDLKIWCWNNADYSSAPMLHHMVVVNIVGIAAMMTSLISVPMMISNLSGAEFLISNGKPDITIGMNYNGGPNSNYKEHYYTVWHELTHASHFAQVGESLWGPYVNYIVTHGFGYGNGTDNTKGRDICELGESWAYANQYYSAKYLWSSSIWFSKGVSSIKNLLDTGVLTRKQLYDCLTKDVKSISDYRSKLIASYPYKSSLIYAAF